jgi:murein DD-endopeptidase MepM/ murein hydrolase activator NlpD
MSNPPRHTRWRSVCAVGVACAVLSGAYSGAAHAAVPYTPPAVSQPGATPSYLTAAVELRAAARSQALADLDRQADDYAKKLRTNAAISAFLDVAAKQAGSFVAPLLSFSRSSNFGEKGPLWKSGHTGEDFAAPEGAPLLAIGPGEVTSVGDAGAYGLRTILTLKNGTQLWYAHQKSVLVKEGQKVKAGQLIGTVGSTGNTTGPHLHLEVRPDGGKPIDPVAWLEAVGVIV